MDKTKAMEQVIKGLKEIVLFPGANFVPGEGDLDAKVMFIGEAPGQKEDELGRPFVGAAGKFLEEMLGLVDLKREDVYISNIVKQRPPSNRDPLPDEISAHVPFLRRQIEVINPKVIALLGRHSMNEFLPGVGTISQVHGRAFRRKDGRVYVPLYHPAAALYNADLKQTLIDDFKKIPIIFKKLGSEDKD